MTPTSDSTARISTACRGYSFAAASGNGTINEDCNSGWVYAGGSGITRLWRYYETGIP